MPVVNVISVSGLIKCMRTSDVLEISKVEEFLI